MFKTIVVNWKTTIAAIGMLLATVGSALQLMFDNDPLTNPDWALVAAAISAVIGLLLARDSDKTSEQSMK